MGQINILLSMALGANQFIFFYPEKEEHKKWKEEKLEKKMKKDMEEKTQPTSEMDEPKKETSSKDPSFTVTIALPGSILDNAQSPELKTYLAGQVCYKKQL